MGKMLKSFIYIIACAVVFLVIVNLFNGFSSDSANAFEWEKQISVYFGNDKMGSSEDCSKVFPVSRTILNAETFGPGALETILKGVTEEEKKTGYFTSINDGVLVQGFEIKNHVAYIDFNSRFNEKIAGSCRVVSIKSQIETTLNNLPDINSVVISVDGETEGILEP